MSVHASQSYDKNSDAFTYIPMERKSNVEVYYWCRRFSLWVSSNFLLCLDFIL